MKIRVRIYSGLKQYISPATRNLADTEEWEVPEGTSLQSVIDTLDMPSLVVFMTSINEMVVRDRETVLNEDDEVTIQPALSGG